MNRRSVGLDLEASVIGKAVVLASVLALTVGACGGGEVSQASAAGTGAVSTTRAVSTTKPSGEPITIRTSVVIAAVEGAEIPATGEVLEGSTLGDAPFCVGGTIEDRHPDPAEEPHGLLDRTITCPDGTVRVGLTPEVGSTPEAPPGKTQAGSWIIVSGTGAFEGLGGSGEMETTYDPGDDSQAHETLTGTVTR